MQFIYILFLFYSGSSFWQKHISKSIKKYEGKKQIAAMKAEKNMAKRRREMHLKIRDKLLVVSNRSQ